jgi:hypothetical protein
MKKSIALLRKGFESSSFTTPEFSSFFKTFKSEFTKELTNLGATNITFNKGHFYLFGFFTIDTQAYYFSLSDVRSQPTELLYRTAKHYKDYTGGSNMYVTIELNMFANMRVFKPV